MPVLVGFAVPYLVPGAGGLAIATVLVAPGAGLIWWFECRTRAALDADRLPNRGLEAGGEDLVGLG